MELRPKSRNYDDIVFSYPSKDGFFYLAFAAALIGLGLGLGEANEWAPYLLAVIGAVVAVIGVLVIRWRHTLILRPVSRSYERMYGHWPGTLKRESGSYEDIHGVVVETIRRKPKPPQYFISLSFRHVDRLLSIDDAQKKDEAIKKLHEWSEELKLDVVDNIPAEWNGPGTE